MAAERRVTAFQRDVRHVSMTLTFDLQNPSGNYKPLRQTSPPQDVLRLHGDREVTDHGVSQLVVKL
ncbi:hypothetical protein EYF80_051550 [Liparis tanakae]|uniref:Uncharacterized protein n=1 Tax=Liparis tanakae TaxID=230148 RepID=A0A4Z2FAR3_9TELE|nr:hypothetical protein EYF80_051550 [Liparis tanakae]